MKAKKKTKKSTATKKQTCSFSPVCNSTYKSATFTVHKKAIALSLNDYQLAAQSFNVVDDINKGQHAIMGLDEEVGEVAGILKRKARGDYKPSDLLHVSTSIKKELGDVLWYLADLATVYGFTLEDIAQTNLDKLTIRREQNTIHGFGGDR